MAFQYNPFRSDRQTRTGLPVEPDVNDSWVSPWLPGSCLLRMASWFSCKSCRVSKGSCNQVSINLCSEVRSTTWSLSAYQSLCCLACWISAFNARNWYVCSCSGEYCSVCMKCSTSEFSASACCSWLGFICEPLSFIRASISGGWQELVCYGSGNHRKGDAGPSVVTSVGRLLQSVCLPCNRRCQ